MARRANPPPAALRVRRQRAHASCSPACIHTRALVNLLKHGFIEARVDERGEVHLYTTPLGDAAMQEP